MIVTATFLLLTFFPFSSEESQILHIPLRHSARKFSDVEVEIDVGSKEQNPNYNLHGILGQGYYIELAVGEPKQLVNWSTFSYT